MGRTANMIIKDIIHHVHIFASISKNVYFADGMALSQALLKMWIRVHSLVHMMFPVLFKNVVYKWVVINVSIQVT